MTSDESITDVSTGELIGKFLQEIKENIEKQGLELCNKESSHISMVFTAVKSKERGGGFSLKLISGDGKNTKEDFQRIEVYAKKKVNFSAFCG